MTYREKIFIVIGCSVVLTAIILNKLLYPADNVLRNVVRCRGNLSQIARILLLNKDLNDIVKIKHYLTESNLSDDLLQCPVAFASGLNKGYIFFEKNIKSDHQQDDFILVADNIGNHPDNTMNLLMGNGSVIKINLKEESPEKQRFLKQYKEEFGIYPKM